MSKHVKIIFGSEETNMHHDLDIHPIPEKVLYINDLTIADTASYYESRKQYQKALTGEPRANGGILPDDNVRIYVPLDLNANQILHRLHQIYRVMGSPDDMNESDFCVETGKIIAQLEIYDQVWVARDLKNAVKINSLFIIISIMKWMFFLYFFGQIRPYFIPFLIFFFISHFPTDFLDSDI